MTSSTDTSSPQPGALRKFLRRKAVRIALGAALAVLAVTVGIGVAMLNFRHWAKTPLTPNKTVHTITIAPGQGFAETVNVLQSAGLIAEPWKLKLLARIQGADRQIKAGEYRLSAALTPAELLQALVAGEVVLYRLTVPEGYTLKEIAALVAEKGWCSEAVFLKWARDPDFARELNIPAATFEGYLFPETYFFAKDASCRQIIHAMVDRFNAVFTPDWRQHAEKIGFSVHQIVTLASIIEKETGAAFERPLISSVFHNRLKKGMRLESDPTVIYGLETFNGNLTRKDLKAHTPYNTYRIRGLPPGPIANPGAESLKAALYPDTTDYLFFVSKKDTTHYFSKTIAEHNRAVRKYQLRRR